MIDTLNYVGIGARIGAVKAVEFVALFSCAVLPVSVMLLIPCLHVLVIFIHSLPSRSEKGFCKIAGDVSSSCSAFVILCGINCFIFGKLPCKEISRLA